MQDAPPSIQLLEPLPPLVQYALRYRAHQTAWDRVVELRMVPRKGPPAVQALFAQEVRELGCLDHPAFPPLLGSGSTQDRPYYLVPARRDPTLQELLEDPSLGLEERARLVRGLAAGLAALHLRACTVRYLSPSTLAVCRRRLQPYFLHHRTPPPPGLDGLEDRIPPDTRRAVPPSPRADLFHWGRLAYRVLTAGAEPYPPAGGPRVPLLERCPGLAPELAAVLERCLASDPGARPAHAGELQAVLGRVPANLAQPARRSAPREEVAFDYEATVAELRIGGHIPEPGRLEASPGSAQEAAGPAASSPWLVVAGFVLAFLASFFFLGRL